MATPEGLRVGGRRPRALVLITSQVAYQLRVLVRSPIGSFATLVIPLMVLLSVNLLYSGTRLESRGGIPYAQFFTPAMVAFAVVNACYMSVIAQTVLARDEGILKRIRGTPLPPWVYMAGRLGAAGLVALLSAVAVVAVGAGVYGFDVIWSSVPAALVTLAVAMFCFCALGLAVTVLVPAADSALPVAWGSILPLCFISGVFMPIDGAPQWLRTVASVFPLRPFVDDLAAAFNPVTGSSAVNWGHLELLGAWGLAGAAFALVAFRWEPGARGPRRGARGPQSTAVFAVDRVRGLLDDRPRRSAPVQAPPDHDATEHSTVDPMFVEWIEGPAPAEDSSVPPDPDPSQCAP